MGNIFRGSSGPATQGDALPQQGKPELTYFGGPGRGEMTRMAFKQGNIEFTDTRVEMGPAWQKLKGDPNSAPGKCFGTMPVISHGNFLVAQSIATAQYAADLGINKKKPPTAQHRALDTMVLGAHADLQAAMYKCLFGDDEAKAKGKEALPGAVAPLLAGLERMYEKANGPYLYSSSPTLGDLAIMNVITSPFPGLKALGQDVSSYPKLEAVAAACAANSQGKETQWAGEGEIELIYFSGPGRGELTRMALKAGGIQFKDTRVEMGPPWQQLKGDPNSAPGKCFGTMPVIVHGNHLVAQSIATAQYAADLGINKKNPPSETQRAMDMMVLCAHADLQAALYKCLFGDDEAKAKGKEALPGAVAPLLAGLERMYKGPGPFLYSSDGPTLGDLAVKNVVESPFPGLKAMGVDLSPYPKLLACVAKQG